MKYYTIQNNSILTSENPEVLIRFYNEARELPEDYEVGKYIIYEEEMEDGNIVKYLIPNPNWEEEQEEKEKERIYNLKMTPLDFLKAIEEYGITYDMVKQFMEQNPLIERELRFCQNVYRKHPMLNSLESYGITSEILDDIFKKANPIEKIQEVVEPEPIEEIGITDEETNGEEE